MIELSWGEMIMAGTIGLHRRLDSIRRGRAHDVHAAGVPVIAGAVGDVWEIVGKSGSTEDTEKEYGQKDGHEGE